MLEITKGGVEKKAKKSLKVIFRIFKFMQQWMEVRKTYLTYGRGEMGKRGTIEQR